MNELLKKLSPTEFENLVFDILQFRGFRNVVWRTPGADGGRDIEATTIVADASGHNSTFRWYVECKHYSNSLDWPTIRGKVAYAENHSADYLLIATTASLSPKCMDEVARWNADRKRPAIRSWPGSDLPNILEPLPQVAVRYGLHTVSGKIPAAMYGLSLHVAKACQAAYAGMIFLDKPQAALELAAALAGLMATRAASLESIGDVSFQAFRKSRDSYDWLIMEGEPPEHCDRVALRATLCAIHYACRTSWVKVARTSTGWTIEVEKSGNYSSIEHLLREIVLWANFSVEGTAPLWRLGLKPSKD